MTQSWVPHDTRDDIVDYVQHWSQRTELPASQLITWLGITSSKFYDWKQRFGKVNEHNARVPRDHWLTHQEKRDIIDFAAAHPLEGYRRLTYMMIDADVAAASSATVYRVLKQAGMLGRAASRNSRKNKGFLQPVKPHEHWHIDVSYLNISGTFYYLCSILDGYSRAIVHWEIRQSMTEADVQIIVQRAREMHENVTPRIISDNGPQFIAKDFKQFIRINGMTHVRTSPYYPQSNGKLERYHRTIKSECIRPGTPLSLDDARRIVTKFVKHYNEVRLHSAIAYIAPADKLAGREQAILAARDHKLHQARQRRQAERQRERRAA